MHTALIISLLALLVPEWGSRQPATPYQRLLLARETYRKIADSQAWQTFPAEICLRPGQTDPHIEKLRRNLRLTGDLLPAFTQTGQRYDDSLVLALKSFQQRHGLKADGIAGPQTLAALNVTPGQRLQQIDCNLQRWQQVPLGAAPLVLVNIPDFSLTLFDKTGAAIWQTKVIVGQAARIYRTARQKSKISYLVVNPTWNVPHSIIRNEIIPILRKDPRYLARNHMQVYRISGDRKIRLSALDLNWHEADPARDTFAIIQSAGPKNVLGRVKFIFHNLHDQYLHDTPFKSLFNHPVRAYSHGCVRVQDPDILAAYLMSDIWTGPVKKGRLPYAGHEEKTVFLPRPVPLQVGYFTAWADEQGKLQFRPDIYQLDQPQPAPGIATGLLPDCAAMDTSLAQPLVPAELPEKASGK